MRMIKAGMAALAVALTLSACAEQRSGLEGVADAMGTTNLNTIEYSGSGMIFGFGQAYLPGEPWPKFFQRSYTATIDYQAPAMRLNTVRAQGENPPHGGAAQPVAGEQRTIIAVNGSNAWSEGGEMATPNPGASGDRLRQLWATPHGVIKAALANNGTLEGGAIAFTVDGREFKATVNAENMVESVTYLSTNEVIGDFPIVITYSDYADYNGVKFPTHIAETQDGHPTLDIRIDRVMPNAMVAIDVPANVPNAPPPPARPMVTSEKLADGVWYLNAANTRSWAVEMRDHIVVVEGIASEARSLAANEEIARLIPNKPIRYVVNTHAHYDHAGGLRTYVAQGATVVTHETNKAFYEQAWARPRTIAPDTLSMSPKPAMFETMTDKKVMTDGNKVIELYHMANTGHNGANLIVFMPREGLVFWGDGYNPPAGNDPRDFARTPEFGIDLYRTITALNLNVRTIAPAHGSGAKPYDNLKKALGLMPL
jgi:glyoxylase-like metal-dependent hydrolase (beta-lactamase superfamily II)